MRSASIDTLLALNTASIEDANTWFMQTCTSEKWCAAMVRQRPFDNIKDLIAEAKLQWDTLEISDYMQAFNGHPMIGDMNTLRHKYANTKALASNEQSGTQGANEKTLQALQKKNQDYLQKHGFIFIICATGLSADAMLHELEVRLPNATSIEIENAAKEQMKITIIRIKKAFSAVST